MRGPGKKRMLFGAGAAVLAAAALVFAGGIGTAAGTPTPLKEAVAHGKQIFEKATFGGNGRTCATCHAIGAGGAMDLSSAAATYPKYSGRRGKVITLQDQIRGCVVGALKGKPPAYGSKDLRDMVCYLTSLSEGKPIHMGGKPQ